jgi:riboflavin biosynthesis pyrimidine reductase
MRELTEHAGLEDALLARHVALPPTRPGDRALVRLNMISSIDGATTVDGVSGGLGNRSDHSVFRALRDEADAVIVGLATVLAEKYRAPDRADLQLIVVATRPAISGCEELFTSGSAVLVLPDDAPSAPEEIEVWRVGSGASVDLAGLAERLVGRVAMLEGGPRLAGEMLALGLVDEFFHTVAPLCLAGESARVAHGPTADARPWTLVHGLCDEAGYLFLRYGRRR